LGSDTVTLEHQQKHISVFIYVGIVVATFVAYEPIRHNGFVKYDDNYYIYDNPQITSGISWQSLGQAFTKPHFFMWHPLTTISHMADCQLFGLNPLGHHLVSVAIHIVNALLLLWILQNITGAIWPSAFVAAVFALHPIQVEAVAWASERKTVLSGLFWLLTMAVYIHYARGPRLGRYLLVPATFGLCILTKPVVITLPFVLLLLDYWPLERIGGPSFAEATEGRRKAEDRGQKTEDGRQKASLKWLIIEKIPLMAMSAILAAITFVFQQESGAVKTLKTIPLDYRIANIFFSYIRYIGKMIWPSRLAVLYPYNIAELSTTTAIICAALFSLITILAVYVYRRHKYAATGWLWYVVTLVPVIGLVQSGDQAMANRYMYLPMSGLLIIIAMTFRELISKQPRLKIITLITVAILLPCLLVLTRMQVRHWQNSLTLFGYALKTTENNPVAENNYGNILFSESRFNEAEPHFRNALRLIPSFPLYLLNLGKTCIQTGKTGEAITCFKRLLNQDEPSPVKNEFSAYYYLGVAYNNQGKFDEAIECFNKVKSTDPGYEDAQKNAGVAMLSTGRIEEAEECFAKLLQKNDDSTEIHYNMALAEAKQQKYDDAVKHLKIVLALDPNYPNARNKMVITLIIAGRPDEATKYLNKGLNQEIYASLGSEYIQAGEYDLAIENLTKAIELKPDNIDVLNKLAWLFAAVDDTSIHNAQKAVEFAQRGCELTDYKDPMLLDTLAVAYAAADRFDEAKATAEKALNIAKETGRENLAVGIQERIKFYETGQPYRQK
jgi:tetratricopeptide (TPR) repeat protein